MIRNRFNDEKANGLWATVDQYPLNFLAKVVLADRLQEIHGERSDARLLWFAQSLRWCAKHQRTPRITPKGRFVMWSRQQHNTIPEYHALPGLIFDMLKPAWHTGRKTPKGRYESQFQCYDAITTVLATIDDIVSV